MNVAYINGKILTWARQRAGFEIARLAKGKVTIEKLRAWESGDEHPSQAQAIELADRLGISYAMLFMPEVPETDTIPLPDLRTIVGGPIVNPSLDFREVVGDTLVRQDWVREERIEFEQPQLEFVGRFSIADSPQDVAADMRRVLGITAQDRIKCADYEAFIKHLGLRAEAAGILVMRSAVVRHITSRPLSVEEFRGFALADAYAPVVFVNDSDAKAAQVFTIAHELAHIWIAEDGVSDRRPNQNGDSKNAIEIFCDRVAAEFLAQEQEFKQIWGTSSVMDNARRAARHFRVSTLVALRRAKDLKLITFQSFLENVNAEYDRFREIDRRKREEQKKKENKGGNFWASFQIRNGNTLNATVVSALVNRRTTYTEAAGLLGLTTNSTIRYLRRVGAG